MHNKTCFSDASFKQVHLVLIFFSLFFTACSKQEQSFFPLSDGYRWRYDVTQITRDGLEKQQYILTNLGESQINNMPVFLRRSLDGTTLYYSISNEGIVYLGNTNDRSVKPEFKEDKQIVIRNPISVNTEWKQSTTTKLLKKTGPPQKTEFKIIAEVPVEVKIESMDEVVSVPAGRFERCMKVTMSGSTFKDAGNYVGLTLVNVEQTNWYAKGIGLVKMERLETTKSEALDKGTLSIELAEYESGFP